MIKNLCIVLGLASLFWVSACGPKAKDTNQQPEANTQPTPKTRDYPATMAKALEAHGGIARWESFGTLEYDLKNSMLDTFGIEHQLIDLWSRKVLLTTGHYKIGYDGQEVWITPNLEANGPMSPRFYHNLIFYFFGIPFLLADPGINYEDLGLVTVAGKPYEAVKVTYKPNVGDSDKDIYVAHFNPETHQLELLLYTVTYFSGEKHENYNALVYDQWQTIDGLVVPQSMKGYKYESDTLGELRYAVEFTNVGFKAAQPDAAVFAMPQGAAIDPLKKQ